MLEKPECFRSGEEQTPKRFFLSHFLLHEYCCPILSQVPPHDQLLVRKLSCTSIASAQTNQPTLWALFPLSFILEELPEGTKKKSASALPRKETRRRFYEVLIK
jgi:hypothetical protein